jgi:U3 small nucleolar RNA-associated protein 11
MQKNMAFTEVAANDPKRKHTVFVETRNDEKEFDEVEYFDTPASLLGRISNRPRNADLASRPVLHGTRLTKGQAKKAQRTRELQYKEVAAREKRRARLSTATAQLEKKDRLSHDRGPRQRIVKSDGTVVHKWKRKRKR